MCRHWLCNAKSLAHNWDVRWKQDKRKWNCCEKKRKSSIECNFLFSRFVAFILWCDGMCETVRQIWIYMRHTSDTFQLNESLMVDERAPVCASALSTFMRNRFTFMRRRHGIELNRIVGAYRIAVCNWIIADHFEIKTGNVLVSRSAYDVLGNFIIKNATNQYV